MAEVLGKFEGGLIPMIFTNCGAGVNSFHVDSYGRMQVCMLSRTPSYDLRGVPGGRLDGVHSRLRRQKPKGIILVGAAPSLIFAANAGVGQPGIRRPGSAGGLSLPDRPFAG